MEQRPERSADDEINLLDYLIILLKRKRLILGGTFGFVLIVAIILFIMPSEYQAEVRFLPPPQSSSSLAAAMLSAAGGGQIASFAGSLLGVSAPGDMYIGLLSSRTVLDKIIDRFDLMKRYSTVINRILPPKREDVRKKLRDDIIYAETDQNSGIVSLTVLDKDPNVAKDMANAFLDEMEQLSKGLAVTEAAKRRIFYGDQLKDAKSDLVKAEEDMKIFQEKTGVLQVDAQAQAVITSVALLRAQIAAKAVEVRVLKTYTTANNPDLQKAEDAIQGMKAELSKLEVKKGTGPDPLMPTGRMPSEGLEYMRKLRDVKFYEALYELLIRQYEAAKLDETRDIVVVQEIDRAVVPTKAAKPKRVLIIVLSPIGGFILAVIAAFFVEMKEKFANNPDNQERIELLREYCRLRRKQKPSSV